MNEWKGYSVYPQITQASEGSLSVSKESNCQFGQLQKIEYDYCIVP